MANLYIGSTNSYKITLNYPDGSIVDDAVGNLEIYNANNEVIYTVAFVNNTDGTYTAPIPDTVADLFTNYSRYYLMSELEDSDGNVFKQRCKYTAAYKC